MDGSSSKPQGSLGRQFVMSALAQAIISPIVGKLMDLVSQTTGKPNYLVPFMGNVLFLILTIVMVCFIKLDVSLPKSEGFKVSGIGSGNQLKLPSLKESF